MKKILLYWSPIVILATIILCFSQYVSSSNDSRFYSEQVIKYSSLSWQEMLSPKWGNNYGFDPNSYMRDQFPGQLLMGIAVTKLGFPSRHSLHILEMFFQLGSIFLIFLLARNFYDEKSSKIVFYTLLIFPLSFSHILRANHESGILFFSTLSILSGLFLFKNKIWLFLLFLSAFFMLFIKGPFIIFSFALSSFGFIFNPHFKSKFFNFLLVQIFTLIICAVIVWYFEQIYMMITGESFLTEFYNIQFKQRALDLKDTHPYLIQRIFNFYYYFEHCLTYSLPWSFFALILFIKKIYKTHKFEFEFVKSKLSILLLLSSLIFCIVFSTSNRIAGRYAFPAYYFSGAWFGLFVLFNSVYAKKLLQKMDEKYFFYIIPCIWFLAFVSHFI